MRPPRMTVRRWMAVVALTAVLLSGGLLLFEAGEAQARAECSNNLKNIGIALHSYHSGYDTFPAATVDNPGLPPTRRLSWIVVALNFLEQGLGVIVDLLSPWDSVGSRTPFFIHTSTTGDPPPYTTPAGNLRLLRCPAHRDHSPANVVGPSDYVGIAGLGTDAPELPRGHARAGVFGYDRRTRLADITDGASQTMMIAETVQARGPWIAGGPATVRGLDPSRRPYIGRGRQFGGTHRGGAMVAFADGSVRFIPETIDPKLFEALATVAGGEPLPDGWD